MVMYGQRIGSDLEGSGHDPIKVLFHHMPGRDEENHRKPQ
jgi:hypothetical protein